MAEKYYLFTTINMMLVHDFASYFKERCLNALLRFFYFLVGMKSDHIELTQSSMQRKVKREKELRAQGLKKSKTQVDKCLDEESLTAIIQEMQVFL